LKKSRLVQKVVKAHCLLCISVKKKKQLCQYYCVIITIVMLLHCHLITIVSLKEKEKNGYIFTRRRTFALPLLCCHVSI